MRINNIAAAVAIAALTPLQSQAANTYTPAELRQMVAAGDYPRQGSPSTQSESMSYSACISKIAGVVESVRPNYPTMTILSTDTSRMEKLWINDTAMTLTCSAADGKLIITTAPYK